MSGVSAADLLVIAALAIGFILIPIGLPGLWLMVGAAVLHRVFAPASELGVPLLLALTAIAAVAEVAETALGVLAARRLGATRWGMWGAFLGGVAGAIVLSIPFPLAGTLLGAFAGAFAGALLLEWMHTRALGAALRAGAGAFLGRVAAVAFKAAAGVAIIALVLERLA
ncbi:MAG TPA: DUF456 family protein [Gemmatimonadota bacterium]